MSSYTVLMVAEKPSICTSVAEALYRGSGGRDKLQARGRSPPVYEFQGSFLGRAATIRVTSVTGHVFSLDFPSKYQSWDAIDPLELFSAPTLKSPEGKGGIVKHLEREARGCDALCLWMDCDREGENICFEVIQSVYHLMRQQPPARGSTLPANIYRAKFSAVTQKDIEKAMQNLVAPNENEAKSVDARQELDLKVGVAFSRFQTKYFQGKYGNLDSAIISYGPCQTPTLGFCVQRHDEIQSFVSESFWNLDVGIEITSSSGTPKRVSLEWERGRLFDQSIADTFAHILNQESELYCYDVKVSETRRTKPTPLNTVEMLKLASKNLGIGPHAAMRAAEHLYLSGYLSYPRTESTSYPKSFDIRDALAIQRNHPEWGDVAHQLLREGYSAPRQGHDAGDHPPITPVGLATDLSGDNLRIYELVTRHFLATVSKDAIYLQTKAKFRTMFNNSSSLQEEFVITGRREIDPGYLLVYGTSQSDRNEDCADIPDFQKDNKYRLASVLVRQGQTSAPGYLTESELIGLMEKHGIGTDASIPTHINNIMTRNYVTLGNGRTLIPTDLGVVLVHGYLRIDPDLVLPDVRAAIESFCDLIAKGTAAKDQVVKHSLANFEKKFAHFRNNIGAMDSLFEASFSPLAATGKPLSKCGKCFRYMKFIPLKPQRLYCATCEETYSLPQNGTIKLYKELKCPLDNFDLVLFSLGNSKKAQGKSYPLCPCCYNFPPSFEDFEAFEKKRKQIESGEAVEEEEDGEGDEEGGEDGEGEAKGDGEDDDEDSVLRAGHMGCNSCMHPSCKHSAVFNGICQCPGTTGKESEPCPGTLILDVNSKPNWKLACNQCNTLIRFKSEIHNITPLTRKDCTECGVRLMNFEFNKLKSPLPNGQTTYQGCIVCDDFLNGLTEIMAGRTVNITVLRQMRHRRAMAGRGKGRKGRGGGRGGRGRGRKSKSDILMSFSDF